MRCAILGALAALSVAGCQKPAVRPAAAAAAAGAVNPNPHVTTYLCADGEGVSVGYPDKITAVVSYRDHAYTLKLAPSADGARYVGMGLQWWSKGLDRGALASVKDGEMIASDPGMECLAPSARDAEPPAPGTPGGLPDDRTPISEAPFTPTSAQGAANVLQTYLALIEAGKVDEAAKLRIDGQAVDLSPYETYHAEIGAPGAIEGAAGSFYVEVPVVLYGRLTKGGQFHQSGRAILRRVNDVPGSTAEQRRWRIAWFDLK